MIRYLLLKLLQPAGKQYISSTPQAGKHMHTVSLLIWIIPPFLSFAVRQAKITGIWS